MPTEDTVLCKACGKPQSVHGQYVGVTHDFKPPAESPDNAPCAQCNKIRALPWSPTRRDMTLDHLLDLGHARAVEAPKAAPWAITCICGHYFTSGVSDTEKAERERDEANALVREYIEESDAAEVRAHKAETELAAVKRERDEAYRNIQALQDAAQTTYKSREEWEKAFHEVCAQRDEARADRAKWVKVCAERDDTILRLRDELGVFLNLPYAEQKQAVAHVRSLVHRIKDYAEQRTQYPFANAIIDLCNQVLEPK